MSTATDLDQEALARLSSKALATADKHLQSNRHEDWRFWMDITIALDVLRFEMPKITGQLETLARRVAVLEPRDARD